jgi:peptide/nickel transport system substrate-binding protein
VCNGPIVPILWAYDPHLPSFPYDPDKAKQYLADEGWKDTDGDGWLDKDGRRFSFTLKTNKGNKDREEITVMVQAMLKKVGIEVHPNPMEWTVLLTDLNKKQFDATVMGWSVDTKIDMTTIWHSKSVGDKFNFVSYANPALDKLNDTALFEMDRAKAKSLWWQAQEIIAEDQPYTFLYVPKRITFVHNRFKNVQTETIGWHYNLEQWWVPKAEQKY